MHDTSGTVGSAELFFIDALIVERRRILRKMFEVQQDRIRYFPD